MKTYKVTVNNGITHWYNEQGLLHREDGPALEIRTGYKAWYQNDKRHRTDGPAIELANGAKYWYQNGLLHREDGPAVVLADGSKEWCVNGKYLTEEEFNNRNRPLIGTTVRFNNVDYVLA